MRKKSLYVTIAFIISIAIFQSFAAWAAPGLINYQGKVTDADGFPLNGGYDMAFSLYTVATGGTSLWSETQPGVQITDGYFNVHLGAQGSLPDSLFNNDTLYLEITISGETLSPRQRLTSTPYSMNANTMRVVHANGSRSSYGINSIVPIGVITPFYGDPATLPDNWKVCDGSVVVDAESPFNGTTLPDLREKFIRGVAESSLNIIDNLVEEGSDSHTHDITIDESGDHNHSVSVEINKNTGTNLSGCHNTPTIGGGNNIPPCGHSHSFSFEGTFSTFNTPDQKENVVHSHIAIADPSSNLPSYVALHYIIRIK